MTERSVPRRELLSSLATVGTIGAFSGVGTAALFGDQELFTGNLLAAGELDLELCWERHGDDGTGDCTPASETASIDFGTVNCGDSGVGSIRCALRDNPGWLWLRTNCPDDACGIEQKVEVTMWYDEGCDGEVEEDRILEVELDGSREPIDGMRLCDALRGLNQGLLLDAEPSSDEAAPFVPGEECCIGFEWSIPNDDCICEEDEFELIFEFHSEQSRHVAAPTNPWPDGGCGELDCDDTDDCSDCPDFQGISFVAFCVEDGGIEEGEISFTPYFDVEGEAFRIDWHSGEPLSEVVLFYANGFENFDGGTNGSVIVGNGTPVDRCAETKQSPSNPCRGAEGCGVKYEFDEERWVDVCETPLNCGDGGGS